MAEKRIPYFKFFPSDFMNGVRGMSAQEIGLYTMLLCRMYEEDGPIENHSLILSTYCGMREATFAKTLEKLIALGKIVAADGMLSNDRVDIEISNRANDLKNKSEGGKASAKKRQQNQQKIATDTQQTVNYTDTDTDTDTDTEREEPKGSLAQAPAKSSAQEVKTILCQWAGSDAVNSFLEHRRKMKKPFSVVAANRLAGHLKAIFNRQNEEGGHGWTDDALGMAEERAWLTVEADWYFNAKGQGNGNANRNTGRGQGGTGGGMAEAFALAAQRRQAASAG